MGKFTNFLRKIRRALDYICLNNLRVDGMEHLIAGILVVSMAQWFFSIWTAIALTLFILVGKEIVYDKWLRQAEEEKERLALENKKQQKQIEKLQPKADFADAAFKKILFSFGSMESLRNFVPFTDDDCIRYVKQAVKLLISYMGFFYALIGYWRLPLRKIIVFALVANAPSVNSVKCNRFLFDKVATYNFL